jgi:hypothetical protein
MSTMGSDEDKARFFGMMTFNLNAKKLELLSSKGKEGQNLSLVWNAENSTAKHETVYASILMHFVYAYGGPDNWSQWRKMARVFERFWTGACSIWGLPTVIGTIHFPEEIDELRFEDSETRLNEQWNLELLHIFGPQIKLTTDDIRRVLRDTALLVRPKKSGSSRRQKGR